MTRLSNLCRNLEIKGFEKKGVCLFTSKKDYVRTTDVVNEDANIVFSDAKVVKRLVGPG